MNGLDDKSIYIVISQTGTWLSRILKLITHKAYNHASLSLNEDLDIMYSFGRKSPYNPFFAGFVKESAYFGTFKRFSETRVIVVKIGVNSSIYEGVKRRIELMLSNPKDYKYNYLGLWLAGFKICFKSDDRYYCSEFIKDVLQEHNIKGADKLGHIPHPMNFLEIPDCETVFCGKLRDYVERDKCRL